ncbi:hypothetical protein SMACR_04356 [Sordaria macrospora]|uniref:WGS project CABT00000000 data, contig 2.19 n=2 Tax=Sordaria macrospora TaxID=5147 RepID=F7W1L4_SORMK|nr:uncharacterized protein SMAC_04356 [Sordaria macrospora k-hell]KAA8635774.1 hypothetical protein SMACR_04356 [Sordaria macrospora]WPJ57966.1 hypothetical protein SMAC4_04356 [Sordaria macrospora]CCC04989.1 unnamed protein product [Sordaria macrospora k-hell]
MCGQLKTKFECPQCGTQMSTSSEKLTCATASSYGGCGSTSSSNREVTKKADNVCSSCRSKNVREFIANALGPVYGKSS